MTQATTHYAVIDSETLSHYSDAVILSIGISVGEYTTVEKPFKQMCDEGLYIKLNPTEQLKIGRGTDPGVVKFWQEAGEDARKVLYPSPNDVSIHQIPTLITDYFKKLGLDPKKVDWYDRRSYDMPKLEHMFKENLNGTDVPWHYLNMWEVANTLRMLGFDRYGGIRPSDYKDMIYHDALHDAVLDNIRLQKCMIAAGLIA